MLTVLKSPDAVVVLPTPLLGDTLNQDGTLLIKRTINGDKRVYMKQSAFSRFKYTWSLERIKAIELRIFLVNHLDREIRIDNWKGEVWFARIVSSPLELFAKSKWDPGREQIDLTIEFDGYQVS